MSDPKIYSVYEDDNTRVIKMNVRTTPANEFPAEFEPYYIRVSKNVPDYIIQEMIDKEIERILAGLSDYELAWRILSEVAYSTSWTKRFSRRKNKVKEERETNGNN